MAKFLRDFGERLILSILGLGTSPVDCEKKKNSETQNFRSSENDKKNKKSRSRSSRPRGHVPSSSGMHLLEVHLEQFRSFGSARLQLHQGVNVVIGRNGSGKSNLVEAVAFVLQGARCDPLTRRHLVHHGGAPGGGAGGQVVPRRGGAGMAATVRVVLDNTDRRLPVDQDVVEVRRTIGPVKEDALFLQDKRILREELQSLLESAGFSRFNPYYVVRQGQVAEMATCSDRRRLEVIRELTGIQGFDECRRDAEKKMAVVSEELEEVLERLKELDRHIEELREDDKDLKNFQKLDR